MTIASKYLIEKAIADTGFKWNRYRTFSDELIEDLIANYTRESGVRQLERLDSYRLCQNRTSLVETKTIVTISRKKISTIIWAHANLFKKSTDHTNQIGISNGLAWTSCGGEIFKIEAVLMPGKGKLLLTGQLGDVMKESAQAALSYARAHAKDFNINPTLFTTH